MKRNKYPNAKRITIKTDIKIRFGEVDSMGIVWHGNYVKYLEDAREEFGKKYGLGYMDVYNNYGFMLPIVKLDIDYKNQLFYGDEAEMTISIIENPASKLIFEYELRRKKDNLLILNAISIQVFMNPDRK
ncbi:MAG: acyl-CoA thioesterase, partial [Chlorobi bacterium]|nr:acyl-CoA thioesterase [Chlorobiota bacterium]